MNGALTRCLLALALLMIALEAAVAHEVRPGLLQLREVEADRFELLWRVPARGERSLPLEPVFPENCAAEGALSLSHDGARTERRGILRCTGGLNGATVTIRGLPRLRTDVLLRVEYLNGGSEVLRATPAAPAVTLAGQRGLLEIAGAYLLLGVEHILLGIDHLLFVAALLLLVSGWRRLVATVTAFTLAHSVTLAGAALGFLSAPPALIEVLIALSIAFVAAEVVHLYRGRTSLTARRPWLIAFAFGLLHGFGFAGALREIGLPPEAVPEALLFFNLGVEAGQLLFIAVLLVVARALTPLKSLWLQQLRPAAAYAIGSLAAFWTLERASAIWL